MEDSFPKPNNLTEGKEKLVKKILLAEDVQALREVMYILLSREGYKVDEAVDGQQLLDKLNEGKEKYDLIVTDNNMPKLSGLEALRIIHKDSRFSNIPVIFNSATLDSEIRREVEGELGGICFEKGGSFLPLIEKIKVIFSESKQ